MFIQTTSQLPNVQNDVLTGQYAGLLCIIAWSIPRFFIYLYIFASHFSPRKQQLYVFSKLFTMYVHVFCVFVRYLLLTLFCHLYSSVYMYMRVRLRSRAFIFSFHLYFVVFLLNG